MAPKASKSIEERIAIIDQKIEKKKAELANLEAQKYRLQHPISMRVVLTKAKQLGMSPIEIAEKLGIDMDDGCDSPSE